MADAKEDDVTIVKEVNTSVDLILNSLTRLYCNILQGNKMITVQVKTPKEKQSVEIEDNANVKKVIFIQIKLMVFSI